MFKMAKTLCFTANCSTIRRCYVDLTVTRLASMN